MVVKRAHGRDLDKLAVVQYAYAVAEEFHHRKVMRDEEKRKAVLALQMAKQVDDLCLNGHIQRRDRFVRHQKLRLHAQRPCDGDALALPTGELGRVLVEIGFVKADIIHLELGLLAVCAARRGDVVDAHGLGDDIADCHARVEARGRVLKDHLACGLQHFFVRAAGGPVTEVDAIVKDMLAARLQDAHRAARGRRLAGTRLADKAENLPAANLKRDVVQRLDGDLLRQREDVAQVLHIEQNVMFCHRAPPTGGMIFGARSSSSHVAA